MRLFVLRHGKAGEGFPDSIRELTRRGRHDVAEVTSARTRELDSVGLLLHSPLVRARQTAEIALQQIDSEPRVEESTLVTPEASVADFSDYLAGCTEDVLICTHNPFAAELVSWLCGRFTTMPTAALAALEFPVPARGRAKLLWLEAP